MSPNLTSAVQFCPIKSSKVTYIHLYTYTHIFTYIHACIHTFIHLHSHIHINHTYICAYIHTLMHMRAHIQAYTLSCTYIHTYRGHLYTIAYTTLSLDSTKSKETKQNNKMSSLVCLTQRYHQVYTSSDRFHKSSIYKYTFHFSPVFSQVLPPQHYIYRFLPVSCSPTMIANTTLPLPLFYYVLLSNNDSKHNTTFTAFHLSLALQQ